ncbi:MAG: pentapeptide repeat-containing protein [Candidatus Rifleibacteriota bacterium]
MAKKRPDYSDKEVSIGFLGRLYPQIGIFSFFFDDDKTVYTRSSAPFGILKNFFQMTFVSAIFIGMIVLITKLEKFLNLNPDNSPLAELAGIFIGLPSLMAILVSMNAIFDLCYLFLTGKSFNVAGAELKPVKTFMLVFGFLMIFVVAGYGYFYFSSAMSAYKDQQQLSQEQIETMAFLDKGRAAWNEYITRTPMVRISFKGLDLSKRKFEGFFFMWVDFSETNLSEAVFSDCHLGYAKIKNANCEKTAFEKCYLVGTHFEETDLTKAIFSQTAGEKKDLARAKLTPEQLESILPPEKSRWYQIQWFDYRDPAWLREKGFATDGRSPKGLKY